MCADRVEISQHDALDVSTAVDVVGDNLLVDFLGVSIRRGGLLMRSLFGNRKVFRLWLTINGAAGREDDSLDIVLRHQFQEVDERYDIVAVIEQWLLHALAYCLAGSEMDNTLDSWIFLEYSLCGSLVTQIHLFESWANTCNLLNAVQYFNLRI